MKKKMNYIKLAIDLVMAISFVLFFNKRVFGGLTYHEIAGLAFTAIFFTHIALNWKWVKTVTVKIFSKSLSTRTRIGYLLNLLLLITMSFVVISGVLISEVVFPNLTVTNEMWFKPTHISVSFLVLVLIAAHLGLHWKWVMNVCKKIFRMEKTNPIIPWVGRLVVLAILLYGSYSISTTNFLTQLEGVSTVFTGTSTTMGEGGMGMHGGDGNFDPSNMPEGFEKGERPTMPDGDETGGFTKGDGGTFANGERPEGFAGGRGGDMGSVSFLDVMMTYGSIISVFTIIVYYLDKLLVRFRRKKQVVSTTINEPEITNA